MPGYTRPLTMLAFACTSSEPVPTRFTAPPAGSYVHPEAADREKELASMAGKDQWRKAVGVLRDIK